MCLQSTAADLHGVAIRSAGVHGGSQQLPHQPCVCLRPLLLLLLPLQAGRAHFFFNSGALPCCKMDPDSETPGVGDMLSGTPPWGSNTTCALSADVQ